MGLDTSFDAWHGPYSAFTRWRHAVAEAAGYAVWKVVTDAGPWDTIMIDWGHVPEGALYGMWDKTPDDPFLILFTHSDCEGNIFPEQAGPLADALEAILPKFPAVETHGLRSNQEITLQFIRGLREAVIKNAPVEFH